MIDFRQRLAAGLDILEIDVSSDGLERLSLYFSELKKWSKKVNLIARSASEAQIIENHFIDSLTLLPLLQGETVHLLDIGTGAGFPALVCKAAAPEFIVTLVEPRQKRVSFLGHIVRTLDLTEVNIVSCRAEDQAQLPAANTFTHITARAVSDLGTLLQMVERFALPALQLICMKGPRWQEELEAAEAILARSAFDLERVVHCTLPFTGAERSLLLFKSHE